MTGRRHQSNQMDLFVAASKACDVAAAPVSEHLAASAARVPGSIRIGTSSWSFPGWAGIVYGETASQPRLARHGLEAYARHPLLRAVGIDRTFYAPASADDLAKYAAVVGDDFRFLMKAHEASTLARFPEHPRYGPAAGRKNELFLEPAYATEHIVAPFLDGLGNKGGPLLFQIPPQDLSAAGGPANFVDRLHRFLEALPRGPLYAVELRDARLLTPAYRDALIDTGACHCFNVHPTMPDIDVQALRVGTDYPVTVVRWMLGGRQGYEQARERYAPFDRLVDEDPRTRMQIASHCFAATERGREAYVIINNKAEGSAPLSAFALAAAILRQEAGGSGQ